MFTQPFIQTQIKENIKAPRHWPLCGEFTGTGDFPAQRASYAENVSIWWRHHEQASYMKGGGLGIRYKAILIPSSVSYACEIGTNNGWFIIKRINGQIILFPYSTFIFKWYRHLLKYGGRYVQRSVQEFLGRGCSTSPSAADKQTHQHAKLRHIVHLNDANCTATCLITKEKLKKVC